MLCRKEGEKRLKLSEIAKEYHVSPQAIRNRLQRAGYPLESIREPGTNEITEDGQRIIRELFAAAPAGKKQQKPKPDGNTGGKASGSGSKLAVIQAENTDLRIQAATAEALAAEREKTIALLMEQLREKDATIAKLSAAVATKAALPEPAPAQTTPPATAKEDHRRGWFARFKGKKNTN